MLVNGMFTEFAKSLVFRSRRRGKAAHPKLRHNREIMVVVLHKNPGRMQAIMRTSTLPQHIEATRNLPRAGFTATETSRVLVVSCPANWRVLHHRFCLVW